MSDPKPDRILAEESDNPWVKLILWAHEDSVRGTERWNGFIKYLVEERLDTDSAAFKSALPLSGEALEHAKNFFPNNADFKKDQLVITIENHIFSEELNFNGAIFAQPISFTNCRFKRSVNFYKANFERAARFSGSKFLETVDFGNAQFRVAALFERVTFCGKIIFYWSENESNLLANFRKAIFKKMTPVFHGLNFHPAWDVLYHTGGRMVPFVGGHAYVEEHTLKALRAAPHVLHFLSAMAAILSPFLLFLMALALRLKFRMSV